MFRELIFSDKLSFRLSRHLLFWLVYCIFFFVQSITPSTNESFGQWATYHDALASTYSFVPACIISAYSGLYILWPYYVKNNKYLLGLVFVGIVFMFDIFLNYFGSMVYYSNALFMKGEVNSSGLLGLGYLNAIWAITVMGVAMGIKISKDCYWQQRENLEIARQKTRTELNLQKSRLQPAYLYSSLSSIHSGLVRGVNYSDEMILKLSDVLSYTLYDSDEETVSIQSEIQAVSEFISLEKLKHGERLNIVLNTALSDHPYAVPPMLVLSFLQQVTTISGEYNGSLWDIEIDIADTAGYPSIAISVSGNRANVFDCSIIAEYCKAIPSRLSSVYNAGEFLFECSDMGDQMKMTISILKTKLAAYESA